MKLRDFLVYKKKKQETLPKMIDFLQLMAKDKSPPLKENIENPSLKEKAEKTFYRQKSERPILK